MLERVMSVYGRAVAASLEVFGWSRPTLAYACKLPPLYLFNQLGLALDHVLFPSFRKEPVRAPLFIMGHPRSATTLLHRTLTYHPDAVSFKASDLFLPSLAWRYTIGRVLEKSGRAVVKASTGHSLNWNDVAEEELLLMHLLDTQMATFMLPLGLGKRCPPRFERDDQTATPSMRFLKQCFQRQSSYQNRRQVIARMNYSIHRMNALRSTFSNARFILVYRHPVPAIASHLSLHKSIFEQQWGARRVPDDAWDRYVQRRYAWSCNTYQRFARELETHGHRDILAVTFDQVTQDLRGTVSRVLKFGEMRQDHGFSEMVAAKAVQQPWYRPRHRNLPLSAFGISESKVIDDLRPEVEFIEATITKQVRKHGGRSDGKTEHHHRNTGRHVGGAARAGGRRVTRER